MKEITILIPNMRPPFVHGIETTQSQNIINKLKEKIDVRTVWVIFQPDKIEHIKTDDYEILYYDNYNNAIEILDNIKPDVILFEGELTAPSITFALSGKSKKIPIVTTHFITNIEDYSRFKWFKGRLKITFANEGFANVNKGENPRRFKMLSFLLNEYRFLLRTLKKMDYSTIDLLKFMSFFPRIQTFSNTMIPVHPIASGDLNLCSTPKLVKKLKNAGFPNSTILLCGNPYFDKLFSKKQNQLEKQKNVKKTKVLFCTASMHEHKIWTKEKEDRIVTEVIKQILTNKEIELALKIHPSSSSKKEYEELLKEHSFNVTMFQKENFIELLKQYDVVLSYGITTVLLESILLNKPIVFLSFRDEKNLNLYYDEKIMTSCLNFNELSTQIKQAQIKKIKKIDYENYINKHIGKFDGNCSMTAADAILKICNIEK